MTLYAFDGAGPFDLDAAKAAGGIACTTYIRGRPGGMAPADATRVKAILARGMGASPNWEAAPDFFGTCSLADATWAGQDALAANRACGYSDDGSIACSFSFDFDMPASRYPEMGVKLQRVHDAMGGHYGAMGYAKQGLIDYFAARRIGTPKHWLMMSTFGQPYDPTDPNVCMVQGHDVAGNWIQNQAINGTDINTVTDPHALMALWPTGSPYAIQGDPPMTPAEIQAVADAVWNKAFSGTMPDGKTPSPQHKAAEWLAGTNIAERDDATSAELAAVKAAVLALGAAVAKLSAGSTPAMTLVPSGTITLTPAP